MSGLSSPVAAERGPGRGITRPDAHAALSGPQEATPGHARATDARRAAAGAAQSAPQALAGTGRRSDPQRAPESRSCPSVASPLPGAPLVLDAPTLAAAFGIPLTPRRQLTPTQAATLALVADGMSYRQIAHRQRLTEGGVRNRMSRAFRALGVHGKAAAVRAGVETGILDLGRPS